MRLQARLLIILAVALAPVLAMQVFNQADLRRERAARVADNARREAELIHATLVGIIGGGQQIANLVAPGRDAAGRWTGCAAELERAVVFEPRFVALEYHDPIDGAVCRTRLAHPMEQTAALARLALEFGRMQIGRFHDAEGVGRHLPVAFPVISPEDTTPRGVLVASFSLDWLGRYLTTLEHPPGRTIVIADRGATILARYPEHEQWSGKPFLPTVAPLVQEPAPGRAVVPSFDGRDRLIGY